MSSLKFHIRHSLFQCIVIRRARLHEAGTYLTCTNADKQALLFSVPSETHAHPRFRRQTTDGPGSREWTPYVHGLKLAGQVKVLQILHEEVANHNHTDFKESSLQTSI